MGPRAAPNRTFSLLSRPAPSGGAVLPQLDALRGIAILAVFMQHLGDRFMPFVEGEIARAVPAAIAPWILTVLHHAHWGVDLFFVLSGFSLAPGFWRARAPAAGSSTREFYARRAARVLPGFYLAIAITLATRLATLAAPGFPASLLAHSLVLQGYWAPGGIVIIGAAWSLTTEVGFYLLLPLLARPLLDPARGSRRFLLGFALCAAAWASRAALHAFVLVPHVHTALLEATQRQWISSRLDQFVLGALAAVMHAELTRDPLRAARAARYALPALALSIATLVVGFRLEGELYLSPEGSWPYAIVSLATAGLVLAATLLEGRARAVLAAAPLRFVGVVSYGVFLYHQLAIGVAGSRLRGSGWLVLAENAAAALGLALALGAASWIVVERPAMRWISEKRR
jgi:peptidoglycan/LPS O-acetylase OafA/YrhL